MKYDNDGLLGNLSKSDRVNSVSGVNTNSQSRVDVKSHSNVGIVGYMTSFCEDLNSHFFSSYSEDDAGLARISGSIWLWRISFASDGDAEVCTSSYLRWQLKDIIQESKWD